MLRSAWVRVTQRYMSSGGSGPNKKHSVGKRLFNIGMGAGLAGTVYFGYGYYRSQQAKKTEAVDKAEKHFQKMENWDYGREDFSLANCKDLKGKRITNDDFKGRWSLLYFGFTHCPDICPSELEKTTDVITMLDETEKYRGIVPVFITIDPARDHPEKILEYLQDYHPRYQALTGTDKEIIQAAKGFRVYFTKGPVDTEGDYILDHTLITYLISPDGKLVDYYGTTKYKPSQLAGLITDTIDAWSLLNPDIQSSI